MIIFRTSTATALACVGLAGALLTGCAEDNATFAVQRSPEFHPMTVSVLGVFKEGRMSPDAWEELGLKISPAFGKGFCPVVYDTKILTEKSDLADAIDSYTRANGVTDDLLDQLAPAAKGDAIVVVIVAGHPPKAPKDPGLGPSAPAAPTSPQASGMSGMNGMNRRGGGGMGNPTPMRPLAVDRNAYEMVATLFSLKDHKSIGLVHMGYSGQSADEAMAKFAEKLKATFADFDCVGWNPAAQVDVKKIKALETE